MLTALKKRAARLPNVQMNLAIVRLACCCGLRASEIGGLRTGYWERSSVASKPSRLIVHFARPGDAIVATMPTENTNGNFAYANTANRPVGGLSVRILPVIKLAERDFRPYPDWEWLLWYCFSPKLQRGSSGQLFDGFDPASGRFTYMGRTQPYIAAGLVTLNLLTETFVDEEYKLSFTYLRATEALRDLIRVPYFSLASAGRQMAPHSAARTPKSYGRRVRSRTRSRSLHRVAAPNKALRLNNDDVTLGEING